MASVTFVKKAQQRYATKPVIDPATGKQKRTPVMRNGEQRTTKRGALVFLSVTERDLTKPLPPHKCDFCNQPIEVGTPYKHITPKSGPYGGSQRNRHADCPTWQQWEYSNSLYARVAQIQHELEGALADVETTDDADQAFQDAASSAREIEEEKREGASNIEEGFGHATSSSEALEETADNLDSWASEMEDIQIPDLPEPEEDECDDCLGSGKANDDEEDAPDCEKCKGTGQFTPEEPTEEQMEEWRSEVQDLIPEFSG